MEYGQLILKVISQAVRDWWNFVVVSCWGFFWGGDPFWVSRKCIDDEFFFNEQKLSGAIYGGVKY